MHKLAIAALILSAAAFPSFAADDCHPKWGYTGSSAPEYWSSLDPAWKICGTGTRQSPIEFQCSGSRCSGDPTTTLPELIFNNVESSFTVEHRAYDIEVKNVKPEWKLKWGTREATLVQFHFHVPAEHWVNHVQHAAEIHFLFQDDHGPEKIVVAVWIKKGTANGALQKIINLRPTSCPYTRDSGLIKFKMEDFLRNRNHYATYAGSLTTPTPTCSEDVTFIMTLDPIEATDAQINALAVVQRPPGNVRPLQVQGVKWRRGQ